MVEKSKGIVVERFSIVDEAGSFSNEELCFNDIPENTEVVILCTVFKPWKNGDVEDIKEDNAYIVYIPSINDALMVNTKLIEDLGSGNDEV